MATYKLTVLGRFPSMNEFIEANRASKQKGNRMKQKAQNEIAFYILDQLKRLRIDKPIYIKYEFYEPNKRRDLDNIAGFFHKVFQDALVDCRIIMNDSWHYIVGFSDDFFVDHKNPRIEIEIEEVGL